LADSNGIKRGEKERASAIVSSRKRGEKGPCFGAETRRKGGAGVLNTGRGKEKGKRRY